jgi:hypothetical protein
VRLWSTVPHADSVFSATDVSDRARKAVIRSPMLVLRVGEVAGALQV